MKSVYYKKMCPKCGRKILVFMALIGVNHNAGVSAICADCIDITSETITEQEKSDLKAWLEEAIEASNAN